MAAVLHADCQSAWKQAVKSLIGELCCGVGLSATSDYHASQGVVAAPEQRHRAVRETIVRRVVGQWLDMWGSPTVASVLGRITR